MNDLLSINIYYEQSTTTYHLSIDLPDEIIRRKILLWELRDVAAFLIKTGMSLAGIKTAVRIK